MTERAPPVSRGSRRPALAILAAAVVLGIGGKVALMTGVVGNPFAGGTGAAQPAAAPDAVPTAKTIRPRREASLPITVDQLATVEAYYQADLRARASGVVLKVHRDIGDKVRKGDLLVEIDVPESDQDVGRNDAMVLQRRQELKVSEAKWRDSKAAKDVSAATIRQREADVEAAVATRELKKRRFDRFKDLAARGSVVGSLVEEEERDYLTSSAVVTAAKANVDRARADYSESESKVEAAAADIDLKSAQIEVAKKDLDRAKAVAEYGRLVAPFDGVVIRRTVNPGSFVQNATTGASEPLISVAREDIVTIAAKFPDSVAAFVRKNTPAVVQVDDLPGVTIPAAVTRYSPSVATADRTMRVEVDLFNGDEADHHRLTVAILKGGPDRPTKSPNDAMPVRAFPAGNTGQKLLPGMTGTLRLSLGGFGESFVLPSTAVYSRGGATYLMVVEDGKTKQLSVKVQLNDGQRVRVAVLARRKSPDGTTREVLTELTGREDVVAARQLEFGDGASVKSGPSEW